MSADAVPAYVTDSHPIELELGAFKARYYRDKERVVIMRSTSSTAATMGFAAEELTDLMSLLNTVSTWTADLWSPDV